MKDDGKLYLKKDKIERLTTGLREYLIQINVERIIIGYRKTEEYEEGLGSRITIKTGRNLEIYW